MPISLTFFGDFEKIDEIFQAFITNPSHGYKLNLLYNKQRTPPKKPFQNGSYFLLPKRHYSPRIKRNPTFSYPLP